MKNDQSKLSLEEQLKLEKKYNWSGCRRCKGKGYAQGFLGNEFCDCPKGQWLRERKPTEVEMKEYTSTNKNYEE